MVLLAMFSTACGAVVVEEPGPGSDEPTDDVDTPETDEAVEEEAAYPLEGAACDYLCGGVSCNYRCEADVLYHCGGDNTYSVMEDCAANGQICALVEAPDFLDSEKQCID
jgi:hypothetical protein